jgi:hypothetical protein
MPREVASQTDPDDVRAAVLLRLYSEVIRVAPSAKVMCVGVEHGEPSRHLLMNLSGHNLNLQKQSRCAVQGIRFVDPISGAGAVHVFVSAVELTEPGVASAEGGYQYGPLAGQGRAYKLEFRVGHWEFVDAKDTWVS